MDSDCEHYQPLFRKRSYRERLWRALGYRYIWVDLPDNVHDRLPGWSMTTIHLHFSFKDRLRLLLTGRVRLDLRHATLPEIEDMTTATSVRIYAPGENQDS